MVIEKIQEIKEAETKAEQIIKDAETRASLIKNSLHSKLHNLREEKEMYVNEELSKYRNIVRNNTEREIQHLTETYTRKNEINIQLYKNKMVFLVDSVWKYVNVKVKS